jgi:hypothetical protein
MPSVHFWKKILDWRVPPVQDPFRIAAPALATELGPELCYPLGAKR